jgi:ribonuclease P protein component
MSSNAGAPKAVTNSPSPTRIEPLVGPVRNDCSFPRQNRLRGRSNFLKTLGKGARRHGRWCEIVLGEAAEGQPGTSFGIVVSGKAGNAVRRNRLKRIIREYLRIHKSSWPENKMVVIRIKTPVGDEAGLLAEIDDMLKE